MLFWHRDFQPFPLNPCPEWGNSNPALILALLCIPGGKIHLPKCPNRAKSGVWGCPCSIPYPDVLVGELLHLLLVQAGQEELVLQLLLLQGQQRRVLGLDHALPDPQVHGDGLGHPWGGARGHGSCGDTEGTTGQSWGQRQGWVWYRGRGLLCHPGGFLNILCLQSLPRQLGKEICVNPTPLEQLQGAAGASP